MIYPVNNPAYNTLLQESIKEFTAKNPKKMQALLDFNFKDKALVKVRQKAIDVYQSHLDDLNMFDSTMTRATYENALNALKDFIKQNLTKDKDIESVYDSIIAEINPKEDAVVKMYNGKVEFFASSQKAKDILALDLKMDALEAKLQRIKNEAITNGQTELNSKQRTRYDKTVREFNRVSEEHTAAVRDFQTMKALNQNIFDGIGLGDYYKKYTEFPYGFSQKVSLPNGISPVTVNLKDGGKQYIYRAYPFSDVSKNGNQIIELAGAPYTYLAINRPQNRILSMVEEKPNTKRKIYHFNEDGDVFKTAVFDPKTRKSKVFYNKKVNKN